MRRLFLCAAVIGLTTPGHSAWRVAKSAHFIVYSEDKPEAVRELATELERFDAAMRVVRGLKPTTDSPSNRLTVFQVSNIAAVQKLLGKGSSGIAGFYDGRAGGSVAFVPRRTGSTTRGDMTAETVLLHEYAHHFMYRNFPAAFPLWFSEGYAEFNSTARFVADGSVDLGMPAQHRAGGLIYLSQLPIGTLLASDLSKLSAEGVEVLYGRGWLLTHYLYFAPDRAGQLGKYLTAINAGKPSLDAAREAFGDLAKLDRELSRYMKGRMTYLRVPAHKITIAPVDVQELSPGGNAIMPVFIRSRRGVTTETAKAIVVDARKAAAPYPDDPFVQLALAEAEIDAGNFAQADAAADRVLAKEPGSVGALIFKGRVAVSRVIEESDAKDEDWKQARRWFVRANRSEPNAPEPLIHFYDSYRSEGVKPTENAVIGLRAAAQAAPEDEGLRVTLARQYLVDGKADEARVALATAAFNPHGGPLATFATRVVAAIDKGGATAGLKAWNFESDAQKAE